MDMPGGTEPQLSIADVIGRMWEERIEGSLREILRKSGLLIDKDLTAKKKLIDASIDALVGKELKFYKSAEIFEKQEAEFYKEQKKFNEEKAQFEKWSQTVKEKADSNIEKGAQLKEQEILIDEKDAALRDRERSLQDEKSNLAAKAESLAKRERKFQDDQANFVAKADSLTKRELGCNTKEIKFNQKFAELEDREKKLYEKREAMEVYNARKEEELRKREEVLVNKERELQEIEKAAELNRAKKTISQFSEWTPVEDAIKEIISRYKHTDRGIPTSLTFFSKVAGRFRGKGNRGLYVKVANQINAEAALLTEDGQYNQIATGSGFEETSTLVKLIAQISRRISNEHGDRNASVSSVSRV